jgi:ribosomal protein S18 acetylase RimI-like enzyme
VTALLRAATLQDAEAIARIHVQAWHETYRGLVPDTLLAGLSVARRVVAWSEMIGAGELAPATLVAMRDGTIVGFGSAAPTRDPLLATDGEVTSIYLLEGCKRRGIGRALFRQLMAALCERGCGSAGLWVLDTNTTARRFYEAMGGREGPSKVAARPDVTLHEVSYIWDRIGADMVLGAAQP